ncbi:MAG TPA: rhomboid family intramembrane serine protease [Rhizomicrobium sp.]|nr:rhomboid family intramembrane serine protease [Rhizomicrobium sp.]
MARFGRRMAGVAAGTAPHAPFPASMPASATVAQPTAAATALSAVPFATLFILAVLGAVFLREGPDPSLATLRAMGAVSGDLVLNDHQWWRLFTAPLLHGSVDHIVGNAVVLLVVGILLEPLIGRGWFAATFAIGGAAGALASIAYNDPAMVSLGASGAIMALLALALVCAFNDEASARRRRLMRRVFYWMALPSLLPALFAPVAHHVDYTAHAGGALAGVLMGMLLRMLWQDGAPRPVGQWWGGAIGLAALLIAAGGMFLGGSAPAEAVENLPPLIPDEMIPDSAGAAAERSDLFVAKYPGDPRGHLFRAIHFIRSGDAADAEDQLRTALSQIPPVSKVLAPGFEPHVRLLLAEVLAGENRQDEARTVIAPACAYVGSQMGEPLAARHVRRLGLCL